MSYTAATVQLLSQEGTLVESDAAAEYMPYIDALADDQLRDFHRTMVVTRAIDLDAANLQRQGQLAMWIPSLGQEAAQVGSGFAARAQDHIFPAYREHAVARIRGVDPIKLVELLRGLSHGGWDPKAHNNFHLYTLVIGSQTLHATGYAMGIQLDGNTATGNPETDEAVMVYFGDGATSQGDVSEALVVAASYQTPQVFFLQNNHWAISVPVTKQSRTPLYLRPSGFGIPGIQIDGNDVLASFAVTTANLDAARSGAGPGSSRRSPTEWGRTPPVMTPRSIATVRSSSFGSTPIQSAASRNSCAREARVISSSRTPRPKAPMRPPTSADASTI